MRKVILTICFLSVSILGQKYNNYVTGRIIEDKSGKPIPYVNVYLNETSHGTTSDESGRFKIRSVPPGHYEIIASMIGYDVYSSKVTIDESSKIKHDIELKIRLYDFGTVEVVEKRPVGWETDLRFFKRLFLGQTHFANNCVIENEYSLDFKSDGDIFKATAREPLKVINNSLGYKVNVDLIGFRYNEGEKSVQYQIKTFFEDLKGKDKAKDDYYDLNRRIAFSGSLNHFLYTLTHNEVEKEGYDISITEYAYNKIKDPVGINTIKADSVLKRGSFLTNTLKFKDYLRVVFEDPLDHLYRLSYLKLNYAGVELDEFGLPLSSLSLQTFGEWSKKGFADMLPKYYLPD